MAARGISGRESIHRQAFAHYLRTGQRLTNAEWLDQQEHKFNPYHDEIGRFTSPPGVTVSYGKRDGPKHHDASTIRTPQASREGADSPANTSRGEPVQVGKVPRPDRSSALEHSPAPVNEAVLAAIRDAWAPEAPIISRLDLRIRQFHLDDLRRKAGPNPSATDKTAFEETQRRLDAARERLAAGDRAADHEISEFARIGLAPLDTFMSGASLFSGEGDLGDALNVASSAPIIGSINRMGKLAKLAWFASKAEGASQKLIQLGGAFRDIHGMPGYHAHHNLGRAISPLSVGDGPSIAMLAKDHQTLVSSRAGKAAEAFRKEQADLLSKGDIEGAIQLDINDIKKRFGNRYDDSIAQMLKYSRDKGYIK